MKPRIYTAKEIDKMNLKPIRLSPTISGVYRANNILITPSEYSSGIKAYQGYF
jgi:hypothetical protein